MTEATQKAAETRRRRCEGRREELSATLNDRRRAVEICREIRDDPNTGAMARLEAVRLLAEIQTRRE